MAVSSPGRDNFACFRDIISDAIFDMPMSVKEIASADAAIVSVSVIHVGVRLGLKGWV
jgi:hypothetical protein